MDTHCRQGLPAHWYFDDTHFERELAAVWAQSWLCAGHGSEWARPGDYRVFTLADQQVIITRDRAGELRAFHNTCRHRGSRLCADQAGKFRAGRIVCPYHAWAWSLDGKLLNVPKLPENCRLEPGEYPLYPVALQEWGGFVFLNLGAEAGSATGDTVSKAGSAVQPWPLASLAVAHREVHEVACNWKVFWENYRECYHCPGVHPELCKLVPLYGEGLTDPSDLPDHHPLHEAQRLAAGAQTWSTDGQTSLPDLPGMGPEQHAAGMTFADFLPGMFIVAHRDYVRSVRILPLAPERIRLTVDWMLQPETIATGPDIEQLVSFARQVVLEDTRVCEINQAGLRCRAHAHGVLLPFERDVAAFDDWVRERLDRRG